MFPLPALPLPKIHRGIDVYNAKMFCRVFGIALLVQWFLPYGDFGSPVSIWSWTMFGGTLWSLLAGAGLTAISFINSPALKLGHYFYAAAGAGTVGILYSFAGLGLWPLNAFGVIGIAGICIASFYWLRNGYSQLVFIMMCVGLGGLGLGLLIPVGVPGGGLPIVMIFSAIGGGLGNVVAGIFFCVLSLGYLALIVNWVLQVFLKKENADPEQVERHALALFFYPFVAAIIFGIFTFFWGLPNALHTLAIHGSYLFLATWGVVCLLELKQNDGLKDLMTTEV